MSFTKCLITSATINIFNTRYLLDRHYEKFHSYVCNFCSALFLSYEAITFHQAKFHQGEVNEKEQINPDNNVIEGETDGECTRDLQSLDDPENPIWSLEEMAELIDGPISSDDWILEETVFDDDQN